jgi:hypothetical protein
VNSLQATAPHATGGGRVKFVLDDETDRVAGPWRQLRASGVAENQYGPGNLFRLNQNVRLNA